jgi:hypothetical protein
MGLEFFSHELVGVDGRRKWPASVTEITVNLNLSIIYGSTYGSVGLGRARRNFGPNDAIRAKIPVECVHRRVKNQMTVRAAFEVALNLGLDAF